LHEGLRENQSRKLIFPTTSCEQRPIAFDFVQLLRFVALSCITTPPNYRWQEYLEHTFPAYQVKTGPRTAKEDVEKLGSREAVQESPRNEKPKLHLQNTLMKWFLDCMTIGALLNTVVFLVLMGILKGQSIAQIVDNTKNVSSLFRGNRGCLISWPKVR
jgi:hypothetical protein